MGAFHEYSPVVQPEQEQQQQRSSSLANDECTACLVICGLLIVAVAISVPLTFLLVQIFAQAPHYSIAIDHVSGLDPTADLARRPTLEPEFNLTLRVASQGLWATECAEPHMYATVSYRGVSLAASGTLTQKICAGPMEAAEHRLVARGARVVVPGSLLDSLAMDMRSGAPAFDVQLRGPGPRNMVWLCGPRMVGDAGALEMECDPSYYYGRHASAMGSSSWHDELLGIDGSIGIGSSS